MKKVIVLSGVSGVGKTYARTHLDELKGLPYVDIADIYQEWPEVDWLDATMSLLRQVRYMLKEFDTVVVEGYFLTGSMSLRLLLNDLKVAGAKHEIWEFWEPLGVCEERLVRQWKRGEKTAVETRQRMDLLHRCWRPQGE